MTNNTSNSLSYVKTLASKCMLIANHSSLLFSSTTSMARVWLQGAFGSKALTKDRISGWIAESNLVVHSYDILHAQEFN